MKIYLVIPAHDATGAGGFGASVIDAGHPEVLVSFLDSSYAKRHQMMPDDDHPIWQRPKFKPPSIV
jgi:hypothetical protein